MFSVEGFLFPDLFALFLRTSDTAQGTGGVRSPTMNIPGEGGREGYECHPQALIDVIQRPLDATMDEAHAHVVSRHHCGGRTIRGDLTLCARPL